MTVTREDIVAALAKIVDPGQGKDLIAGSPDELTERYWPGAVVRLDAERPEALDRLAGREGVLAYERDEVAELQLDDLNRVPDLVAELTAEGVRLTRVEPRKPSLEDLYFAVRDGRAFAEGAGPVSRTHRPISEEVG